MQKKIECDYVKYNNTENQLCISKIKIKRTKNDTNVYLALKLLTN